MSERPPLEARARLAVANSKLQAALWTATGRLLGNRDRAIAELPEADDKRDLARDNRIRALQQLDVLLGRLADRCTENGIRVHWAKDAAEANAIIGELVRGRGKVIKAKSMATEEIHLNAALAAQGVEVVETDLGEWAVQQAKETPSHIIAPALHKTKDEFAQLISAELGRAIPVEHQALVGAARETLREHFISAGVGISGVNLGIAETGTLVLVTNEGNGRLVTSGPKIHIALMGIEKVVETVDDALSVLRVLARSGTGQKLTSYTSFISGPRRPDEHDGPDEVHLIVLDNGRSEFLANELWESLLCIRCGACLNTCPVYRKIGGHAYGSTYPGPIGILATPMIRPDDLEAARDLPHASSLCGGCHEVCPVRIDIPRMILALRARAVSRAQAPLLERLLFAAAALVLRVDWLYRAALAVGRRVLGRERYTRATWLGLGRWTRTRDLPAPAGQSFRSWWQGRGRAR